MENFEQQPSPKGVETKSSTNDNLAGDALTLMKEEQSTVKVRSWTTIGLIIPTKERGTGFFVDVGDPDKCVVATDTHVARAFPSIEMSDGKSYPAKLIKRNIFNEMSYLEVQGFPKELCSPVRFASDNNYERPATVSIVDKREANSKVYTGTMLPKGEHRIAFSNGMFSPPVELSTVSYKIKGAGPGMSGAAIFDKFGAVSSVLAGGDGDTAEGKPIDSVRLDVEYLKSLYKKF
jgi:hypothetical protein